MRILGIALLSLTLSLTSCAQEPSPIVANSSEVGGLTGLNPAPAEKKMAVAFTGSDLFGASCRFLVAVEEHGGEKHFLTKVDYLLHGETLPDIEAEAYRYELGSNSYSDVDGASGTLAIAGALLTDGSMGDVNQLANYESTGKLDYSLRVDFSGDDFLGFSEALEAVTANANDLPAYESSLNQLSRIIFKIGHAGHYDASACLGLKVSQVEEVEFKLGDHDDDHDHDHDDDHDHDHDHD